jgi:hypothetical protein
MRLEPDDLQQLAPIIGQAVRSAVKEELWERRAIRRGQKGEALLLDLASAAAMLGVSSSIVRQIVARGELRGIDIGVNGDGARVHRRFSVEELRRWIAAKELSQLEKADGDHDSKKNSEAEANIGIHRIGGARGGQGHPERVA